MCDNEAALRNIAKDISSIKEHLAKMNGRLGKVESNTTRNEKDIAVLTTRCQLVTHYTDEDVKKILNTQEKTEEKLWNWVKGNGVQLGEIGALVFLIGKMSGWW